MTSESTQNDLRIDPQIDLQTGPQMTLRSPDDPQIQGDPQNKALFNTLLTIAELKEPPSKDWIRPPSQSQE